jgi:hypothetical protein
LKMHRYRCSTHEDQLMTDDAAAVSAKLAALRQELEASIWPTAMAAANSGNHERIRDLVKLKVDIEAIDFALSHRPVG